MTTLALLGGAPEVQGPLAPFNTIGQVERSYVMSAMNDPLSGFLGGQERGGKWVRYLEDKWSETFGVGHSIACNSATSALLAGCMAIGIKPGDEVVCPAYTMSGTVAPAALLGADIQFCDVMDDTFCLDYREVGPSSDGRTVAAIATNLFGHPSHLLNLKTVAKLCGIYLIEDNAQSPFAMENGKYAGTVGDIGCWSLNVHKHFQSGEGGICTTNNPDLAMKLRHAVNHGELAGGHIGLNLRMTELTAAIAIAQLSRAKDIIAGRVALAESLSVAVKDLPGLTPPVVREGCSHSYYMWALTLDGLDRDLFVKAMNAEGVPLRAGYVKPLYELPAFHKFARPCPVTEELQYKTLCTFEVCAHDPTPVQNSQMGNAFGKVIEGWSELMEKAA